MQPVDQSTTVVVDTIECIVGRIDTAVLVPGIRLRAISRKENAEDVNHIADIRHATVVTVKRIQASRGALAEEVGECADRIGDVNRSVALDIASLERNRAARQLEIDEVAIGSDDKGVKYEIAVEVFQGNLVTTVCIELHSTIDKVARSSTLKTSLIDPDAVGLLYIGHKGVEISIAIEVAEIDIVTAECS